MTESFTGAGTFVLRHGGRLACGIPDGETIILTGGFPSHNFVTRWVERKIDIFLYVAVTMIIQMIMIAIAHDKQSKLL